MSLEAMLARDKALELPTPYVPPPGNPLEHHAAGFAQIMCSAVFITGLDPDFAAENVGYFTAPYAERAKLCKPVIDRVAKTAIPIPKDAYYMAGAGGQFTMVIPSHDLVVVRLGHFKGDEPGTEDFYRALSLLVEAVPARK